MPGSGNSKDDRRSALSCSVRRPKALLLVLLLGFLTLLPTDVFLAAAEMSDADRPKGMPTGDRIPTKIRRYVQRLITKYDRDGDAILAEFEWRQMRGEPRRADYDSDGFITREELTRRVVEYGRSRRIGSASAESSDKPSDRASRHPAATTAKGKNAQSSPGDRKRRQRKFYVAPGRTPGNLPPWFADRDRDGDGQLTLLEFTSSAEPGGSAEFARMDINADGVLTASEYVRAAGKRAASSKKSSDP